MVAPAQRFKTAASPCPICGGYDRKDRGHGERCYGYQGDNPEYVYCTREDYAGELERDEGSEAYCHKKHGPCKCGKTHGDARPSLTLNGHKPQQNFIEYSYHDETGRLIYQALRYEPKGFKQRRPGPDGKWIWDMKGARLVPYHLPDILKADVGAIIYIVEGEKDADNLKRIGLIATTNVAGVLKWRDEYNRHFKGRRVVILPDNDEKGRDHAVQVKKALTGTASYIGVVELPDLPEKGDVSDWLAAGGTREELLRLTAPPKRKFTYASEVQTQKHEWLWEDRLAKGEYTLAVGDAGVGKGLTIAKLIAHVTQGWPLPGDEKILSGGVILMSPEDSTSRTLVPRLKAAGADLTKVLLLSEVDEVGSDGETYQRPVSFPEDAALLREAMEDADAVLVVIDPILSLLSGKVDAHKNHAVRQALAHVTSTADKHGCAVLGIMHTTKSQHPNALFRSGSSSAFIEMARCALFFVPDPDGEPGESGVIVNYKNNLRKFASSIRYSIHQNAEQVGYINWQGESIHTREELLNQATPTNNPKSAQEIDILTVLEKNLVAMTPVDLYERVKDQTGQTLNAFEVMLKRKLEQGVLIRPARGLYTYAGNPLYNGKKEDVSNVSSVSSVSDVSNVSLAETYMKLTDVSTGEPSKSTLQAASDETYKTYITNEMKFPISAPPTYNDGPKDALEAAQYLHKWADHPLGRGQIIRTTAFSVSFDVMGKIHHLTGIQIPQLEIQPSAS